MKRGREVVACAAAAVSIAWTVSLYTAGSAKAEELNTVGGIVMVKIPGGSFQMGDAKGAEDAKKVHKVTVSPFLMDKYEVTQEAYTALMPTNPSKVAGVKNPVEQLRWFQAAKYCNARSKKENLSPCYNEKTWECDFDATGYRLPTEAEWEYACKAGAATIYSFGDDASKLPDNAWLKSNAGGTPHPVGGKPANAWGLCDMHGNVMEWCNDIYAADYYGKSPELNPRGPDKGPQRVLRGGGYRSKPEACSAFFRVKDDPANADICAGYPDYGFRCVRKAD